MAGGLPIPANHAFHSDFERKRLLQPLREIPATSLKPDRLEACPTYWVNELPQPQLRVACGFWNTKPRRIRSS